MEEQNYSTQSTIGKMNLRKAFRIFGGRMIASSATVDNKAQELENADLTVDKGGADEKAESVSIRNYEIPPETDDEQARRRIRRFVYNSRLARFIRAARERLFPPPTKEELRTREKDAQRKRDEMVLMADLHRARDIIERKYTDLEFCHEETAGNGRITRYGPKFELGRVDPNEIILRCTYFPRGMKNVPAQMLSESVLTALSEAVGRPVYGTFITEQEDFGMRLFIARSGSKGLPSLYTIAEMLKDYPSTAAPLALPFGVMTNGRPLVRDLVDMTHLLIGGTTKGGKSNFLHAVICTLINRNSPNIVKLDLMDFKDQGIELSRYEGIPHLRLGHVMIDPGELSDYMPKLVKEMSERFKMLKASKKQNIDSYNAHRKKDRLPYLIVIVDEIGQLTQAVGAQESNDFISKITSQGRACGVHFIGATQYPKAEIIGTITTMNIPARLAFHIPGQTQSAVVIYSGRAATDIEPTQKGRAIFHFGGSDEHIVQTPYVTDRQIAHFVAAAKEGQHIENLGISIDPEELVRYALEQNNNRLTFSTISKAFEDRGVTDADLKSLLTSMDDNEYEVGGAVYVVRNRGGSAGRVVELSNTTDETPKGTDASEELQTTNHKQQITEFTDAIRAVCDAWETVITKDDGTWFDGDHIWVKLDLFLLDPTDQHPRRTTDFLADVRALCARFNAAPTDGGFILEGNTVNL